MAFFKFTWRVIRALLIVITTVVCMIAAGFIWPLLLLLALTLPTSTRKLWNFAGTVKVW